MKTPLLALFLSLPLAAEDLPSIALMKSAADSFLGTLDESKRGKAVFPFDGDQRENFKFTPQTRVGLPLKEMNEAQTAAAMKLLDAALSDKGMLKGLRGLAAEEDLAMTLANVLLEGGKKEVIFSEKAPGEILTAEKRKVTALDPVGIPAAEMTGEQKKALLALITEYTGRHRKDLAAADMKKIEKAGIDHIRFGWAGGTKRGEAWYYRVQGPTFLMEAANTQNNANHIHATWRDFEGDFGRDMLSEHYHQHGEDGGDHH